jgi:hypothetical protein
MPPGCRRQGISYDNFEIICQSKKREITTCVVFGRIKLFNATESHTWCHPDQISNQLNTNFSMIVLAQWTRGG